MGIALTGVVSMIWCLVFTRPARLRRMSERQLRYRVGWVRKKPTLERLTAWNRAIGLVGVAFSAFFLVVGVVMIVQAL